MTAGSAGEPILAEVDLHEVHLVEVEVSDGAVVADGSPVDVADEAFRILAVQGVVTSPTAGQLATYLHDVFGATFTVSFMAVIFMIAPDGRLL